MKNQSRKCSSNRHTNLDAVSFCHNCKKYLCNKCQIFHSDLFENHISSNVDKEDNDIFENICKEENHNIKLEFFCKTHNILCCSSCICKIKNEIYGKHTDCDVCLIKEIQEEKKNQLNKNINLLEDLSNNFDKSINELKVLIDKINENKEELKIKIQKIFTKIRNALNDKEEKLLIEVDQKYDEVFIKDDIIKNFEKLPNKIKISLEKGKLIEKNWNENNLNSVINDCINIEKNINDIIKINNDIKKCDVNKKSEIIFSLSENNIQDYLEEIKTLGEIKIKKEDIFENYKIESKNPIYTLNNHTRNVLCLTIINDGRLVSGARDCLIIIYNKETYKPDLIINEHKRAICCLLQLSSGLLASCSEDNTIKLFTINGKEYKLIQTLEYHSSTVYKIIELKYKNYLVSCSSDSSIIFYFKNKNNNEYKKDYYITTDGCCSSVIQTKINEICSSEENNEKMRFYDVSKKSLKASISGISKRNGTDEWLIMLNESFLAVPGKNIITIINVNQYKIARIIKADDSGWIMGSCIINENLLFTGDNSYSIRQWKIEEDNLLLISKKDFAHKGDINTLINLGNGHFASGSDGGTVKIW